MKVIYGSIALSDFRITKLLNKCKELKVPVENIQARYVHFIDIEETLSENEYIKLEKLLCYGDKFNSVSNGDDSLFVLDKFYYTDMFLSTFCLVDSVYLVGH